MAPAIWRTVFVTAEPALTSSGSRQLSDHVVIGMNSAYLRATVYEDRPRVRQKDGSYTDNPPKDGSRNG